MSLAENLVDNWRITTWTEPRRQVLRELWTQGLSAARIRDQLNAQWGTKFTRSAIIGTCWRMGLQREKPAKKIGNNLDGANIRRKRATPPNPNSKPPQLRLLIPAINDLEIPQEQRKQLSHLKWNSCRWPVGNPGDDSFFFCGGPREPDKPYCAAHCARAYRVCE